MQVMRRLKSIASGRSSVSDPVSFSNFCVLDFSCVCDFLLAFGYLCFRGNVLFLRKLVG